MSRFAYGLTLIEVVLVVLCVALCLPIAVVILQFGVAEVLSATGRVMLAALALASIPLVAVSWCFVRALQSVASATANDPASLKAITTVRSDCEAALIVNELLRNDICARVMNDYTFGFLHAHVVVREKDFERAEAILRARQPNSARAAVSGVRAGSHRTVNDV